MPASLKRLVTATALLSLLSACPDEQDETQFSDIEPRVATWKDGTWSIEKRDVGSRSTINSLFGRTASGKPVSLRVKDNAVLVGHWNGSGWEEETATTLTENGSGDMLSSGRVTEGPDGRVYAMFMVSSGTPYLLAEKASGGYAINILPNISPICYDIAVSETGQAYGLFPDYDAFRTRLITVDAEGGISTTDVASDVMCGSLAVDPVTDQPGVVLWAAGGDAGGMVAALTERTADGWSTREVAADGYLECDSCLIPQLDYRGDGAAVISYVNSSLVLTVAVEQPDQLFKRTGVSAPGLASQSTSFQRLANGSLAMVYVLNTNAVYKGTISSDGFVPTLFGAADLAIYPRMAVHENSIVLSYWGDGNLQAAGLLELEASVVDPATAYGYQLGSFLSAFTDEDGGTVIQLFYNEVHVLE